MKLTIGMASYKNFEDVFFTVTALRMYHDLTDCEILVLDNFGDDRLKEWCKYWGGKVVRYERWTEIHGTEPPRQMVFEYAKGDFVLCIDSHVMLPPGSIDRLKRWIDENPNCEDLIQGPMLYDALVSCTDRMKPEWNDQMWGVWDKAKLVGKLSDEPYEIQMHGLGLFGSFRDKWLGFNMNYRGFGAGEGYIHEKYRLNGHKVICLPWLRWVHRFYNGTIPYSIDVRDRIRNYLIGFKELGLDIAPIRKHFGSQIVARVEGSL